MNAPIHVMAARLIDPGQARVSFDVEYGSTIRDIVSRAIKQCDIDDNRIRVTLVSDHGSSLITPNLWAHVKPKPGMQVVIRTIPGRDVLRSVLLVVVAVAAPQLAAGLGFAAGTVGGALATAGLTIVGTLLVNTLIPIAQPNSPDAARDVYAIQGWRNDVRPGEVIPMSFGKMRYAPPFAATSWSEIEGDDQYIRALFTFGYGPLRITDMRIGETSIIDFDGIDFEVREGRADDAPVSLYPRQVIEDAEGIELVRPLPLNNAGDRIEDSVGIETPVLRFTADDASEASVILSFPSGLFRINKDNEYRIQGVVVRIRARLNGLGDWTDVASLDIKSDKREAFFRQHTWTLPTRGRFQIEVTRMTDENTSTSASDLVNLAAIQSIRPEYPINIDTPIALVAIRAKASFHANGVLNSFNALIERETLIHEDGVWVTGYNRTPAAAYISALMAPSNPFPVSESELDWDLLAQWHDWCIEKGLKYDRVHDQSESLDDVLQTICVAGRATYRHDGVKWGVVVDWPQQIVIDHINPRNSDAFTWSRNYFDAPDGFRIPFLDETNNYGAAERIVPWPGHVGDVINTEEIQMPGKTDPDEIWIEARRRMFELIHRPDNFSAMQSGRARVVTRGDLVMGSVDVLQRTQAAGRVIEVLGNLVVLDETIEVGEGYAMRFKTYADGEDQIGTSTVRPIAPSSEPTNAIRLTGTGLVPQADAIVHVGPIASESFSLRVRGIEGAQNHEARLLMVEAAPQIDVLTDAEVPPAWDGRIGAAVSIAALAPAAPRFTRIATGQIGTDNPDGLEVLVAPGAGSTATVTSFEIDHRLDGASIWTTQTVPAATGSATIAAYVLGNIVDLRARAIATGTPGDYTAEITVTIGAEDPSIPSALDASAIDVSGSLGHAIVGVGIPPDDAINSLQFYRSPEGVALDRTAHAVRTPITVEANATASFIDGDATRNNELTGGAFDGVDSWMVGAGWTIASGVASHAAGTPDDLNKTMSFVTGATYRIAFKVSGASAGSVTPQFTGGAAVSGVAVSANGLAQLTLIAASGNNTFTLTADATFDGAVDDIIIFRETASCVDAGRWDYWIEPQNIAGVAGPVSGPLNTVIN